MAQAGYRLHAQIQHCLQALLHVLFWAIVTASTAAMMVPTATVQSFSTLHRPTLKSEYATRLHTTLLWLMDNGLGLSNQGLGNSVAHS